VHWYGEGCAGADWWPLHKAHGLLAETSGRNSSVVHLFVVMGVRTPRASLGFGGHARGGFTVHTRGGQEVTLPCLPTHVHAASISVRGRGIRNTPSGST
jgi:hypothetical protein